MSGVADRPGEERVVFDLLRHTVRKITKQSRAKRGFRKHR
jgi:hypothetical protein